MSTKEITKDVEVIARWLARRDGYIFLADPAWESRVSEAKDLLEDLAAYGFTVVRP